MFDPGQDSFIESIATELRRPVRLDPRLDDRVMEAIEAPEVIPLRPALPRPWILRPWTVSVPPLGALAAAAVFAFAVALGVWRNGSPSSTLASGDSSGAPLVNVANSANADAMVRQYQFLFVEPTAKKIAVVGDFNDWDVSRTLMTRVKPNGLWSVTVPLRVGLHKFQYVVDDTLWVNDPTMPSESKSDLGMPSSLLSIRARND